MSIENRMKPKGPSSITSFVVTVAMSPNRKRSEKIKAALIQTVRKLGT
ncbi:hypothetical protein GL267_013595 [Acidithiobacillus ferrianus]|uniref:Uncharacterized protein n=2 Tax=Acidithiobacillus ferrianus TaxID=2678518 RepID=A0A845U9N9_9PROT|nr:hypothetical protein [Acidithiobacillus ferrianus]NDU41400.1 hypothetical protein [Acidithiobacillus ferrianus]